MLHYHFQNRRQLLRMEDYLLPSQLPVQKLYQANKYNCFVQCYCQSGKHIRMRRATDNSMEEWLVLA
jgi:hypothetical protein